MTSQTAMTVPSCITIRDLKERILEELPGLEGEVVCIVSLFPCCEDCCTAVLRHLSNVPLTRSPDIL